MSTQIVSLGSRSLRLDLTSAAEKQLARETRPLDIEMELYFSCLVRKRVYFLTEPHADVTARTALNPSVAVSFRPVVGRPGAVCDVSEAPVDGVKLARPEAFTPKWLRLDYRGGWRGEFGY